MIQSLNSRFFPGYSLVSHNLCVGNIYIQMLFFSSFLFPLIFGNNKRSGYVWKALIIPWSRNIMTFSVAFILFTSRLHNLFVFTFSAPVFQLILKWLLCVFEREIESFIVVTHILSCQTSTLCWSTFIFLSLPTHFIMIDNYRFEIMPSTFFPHIFLSVREWMIVMDIRTSRMLW